MTVRKTGQNIRSLAKEITMSMKSAHNFGWGDGGSSGGYESVGGAESAGGQKTAKENPGCHNSKQTGNKKKGQPNHTGGAYAGA